MRPGASLDWAISDPARGHRLLIPAVSDLQPQQGSDHVPQGGLNQLLLAGQASQCPWFHQTPLTLATTPLTPAAAPL